ncbi:MAG: hypothetical protein NTW22_07525, partial [Proteobacteria bacterium]|nr:hypothetical protein [Pseudomonadota bacterium]
LARISKADYSYQRDLLGEQEEEIRDFLDKENYLFFPEVILSYKIKYDLSKAADSETPLQKIQSGKKFTSNIDKTKFNAKIYQLKTYDVGGKDRFTILEIDIADSRLTEAINNEIFPFHRIDGNHRLSAAETAATDKVKRMIAPYCILLGEEYYEKGKVIATTTTDTFNKAVKVFFHNINTKTIPLTSEENKKVIIDDVENFPNDELENIIGSEGVLTRELIRTVNPEIFTGIEHILSKQYRTYYIDVFRKLLSKGEDADSLVEKVLASLQAVNILYNANDKLKANSSFGLLTAFLYYHVENNPAKYNFFINWVLSNHIFEVQEIKADSIIKIFDKIAERNVSVFVAMPYYEGSPEIM